MSLTTIIVSVEYGDFLQVTLPTVKQLGNVIVATSPHDMLTTMVCDHNNVVCHQTDVWYKDDAPFNKAAGINEVLQIQKPYIEWLLLLDADIVLPPLPSHYSLNDDLDPSRFYGVRRRNCQTAEEWARACDNQSWFDLPLEPLPAIKMTGRGPRLWGHRPTSNPIAVKGFFQLWNYRRHPVVIPEHKTAAKYDVELALMWPQDRRVLVPWPGYTPIHIGDPRVNWSGRKSDRWDVDMLDLQGFQEAAERHYARFTG